MTNKKVQVGKDQEKAKIKKKLQNGLYDMSRLLTALVY